MGTHIHVHIYLHNNHTTHRTHRTHRYVMHTHTHTHTSKHIRIHIRTTHKRTQTYSHTRTQTGGALKQLPQSLPHRHTVLSSSCGFLRSHTWKPRQHGLAVSCRSQKLRKLRRLELVADRHCHSFVYVCDQRACVDAQCYSWLNVLMCMVFYILFVVSLCALYICDIIICEKWPSMMVTIVCHP